uniref:Uncharacterized protein n=1 Tax=Tetradesmus obliquus TaxID=3088 RepID=A0A383VY84_TETOB|eukprot:jgi/Sobl393_1/8205/SZX69386.1
MFAASLASCTPQQQGSSVASLQRRLRQEVWSMSLPPDQYLLCRSPDGIDSPVRFSPVRASASKPACSPQAQKRAQQHLRAQRAASLQLELQDARMVLSRAAAALQLERSKLSVASELRRNGAADEGEIIPALQGSCSSLQQLAYAAQQHVLQLEAAADVAATGSVVACVAAAISEESCEDVQDDDSAVDDASTAPAAAAPTKFVAEDQENMLQAQGLGEIECLSDDEQYCVQVQMAYQVAAYAAAAHRL